MAELRIKLVVIDNHTLGYIIPNTTRAGILHTSPLKGSYFNPQSIVETGYRDVRLASRKDFDEFNVCFDGYCNDQIFEYHKAES